MGIREDMPAMTFMRALAQLQISKQPLMKKFYPIEYMTPLLHAAAVEFATYLDRKQEKLLLHAVPEAAEDLANSWTYLQARSLMLHGITRGLSKALQTPEWSQGLSKKRISRLHEEYIALIELYKSIGERIREKVQQESSLQSILETKKSLQQADSVKRYIGTILHPTGVANSSVIHRLSLVAMFFIPLSFATSFLGMNVEQLGTGKIDIGFFFLAAALAGAIVIALTLAVKPLDRAMNESRMRIAAKWEMGMEGVRKRDILRESRIRQMVMPRTTIFVSDEVARSNKFDFHEVFIFKGWCGFHFRKLWATVTRTRSPEHSTEA